MVDVRGDVLRPPHGTTPAAVKSNIKSEMISFKSNENIHKKEGGSYLDKSVSEIKTQINVSFFKIVNELSDNSWFNCFSSGCRGVHCLLWALILFP